MKFTFKWEENHRKSKKNCPFGNHLSKPIVNKLKTVWNNGLLHFAIKIINKKEHHFLIGISMYSIIIRGILEYSDRIIKYSKILTKSSKWKRQK